MPGLVLFSRRWAIGSDDFVIPAIVCAAFHAIWLLAISSTVLASLISPQSTDTTDWLYRSVLGLNVTFAICQVANVICDLLVAKISSAGSILDDSERIRLPRFLYARCGILGFNLLTTLAAIAWLSQHYGEEKVNSSLRKCLLATVTWQLISTLTILSMIWGCYDSAGRNWLMLKRFEDRSHQGRVYKRSTTRRRTWRRRKVMLAYQDSWRRRLRVMAGCVGATEDDKAAMTEVAKLFTEFFYELDVVLSDLLAGFALLRRKQKLAERQTMDETRRNGIGSDRLLSGAIITSKTRFMDFSNPTEVDEIRTLRYYMQYALAAYGWPFYLTNNKYGRLCELLLNISILPVCLQSLTLQRPIVLEDNCFLCHSTAVTLTLPRAYVTLIYSCWHSHIGQIPFYVAVDHREKAVVICVRGTLSMNDFITDFNAQPENIPLLDPRPSSAYQAHRGMIVAAMYVFQRLKSEAILESAFSKGGLGYRLMIVGHSLGGGAATILAMLLRPSYPDLQCFVFAPPGGLLTQPAVDLCRSYVTTLIIGKDLVARLALAQMETMRAELVRLLTVCVEPKWRIIGASMGCCRPSDVSLLQADPMDEELLLRRRSNIALRNSSGTFPAMFPPGNVIHVVRSWTEDRSRKTKPQYVALRADNASFNEILISPVMVHDHMPEGIIEALDGLLEQIESSPRVRPTPNHDTNRISPDSSLHLNFCDSNFTEEIV